MSDNVKSINILKSRTDTTAKDFKQVTFGKNVKYIEDYCCAGCENIETIIFLGSIKTIGQQAFYGNASVESIVFPSTVESIGNHAFYGTTKLANVAFNSKMTIGNHAFDKSGIASIDASFSSVGQYAFAGCENLKEVKLTDITKIPVGCFKSDTSLETVSLPSSVDELEANAFDGCAKLEKLDLENTSLKKLNDEVFGATAITSITLPKTFNSIDCFSSNSLKRSKIKDVYFKGIDTAYIKEHEAEFNRFGADHDIKFHPSDSDVSYDLNKDGEGIKESSVYVISISL